MVIPYLHITLIHRLAPQSQRWSLKPTLDLVSMLRSQKVALNSYLLDTYLRFLAKSQKGSIEALIFS